MYWWEAWSTNRQIVGASFPCLQELSIGNFHNLVQVSLEALPSLRVLKISTCGHEVLRSLVRAAPSVTMLDIGGIFGLNDHLWRCVVEYLAEIEEVSIGEKEEDNYGSNLTSLRSLNVMNCDSMEHCSCPDNLEDLHIQGGLKKPFSEWSPQNFPTSLVELYLIGGPSEDATNFSQLSHLLPSSLIDLLISGFEKVESVLVDLQHLTSLRHLYVRNCPKLKDLPEMLLPSLFGLNIRACPNLKERSSRRGSYWPLISRAMLLEYSSLEIFQRNCA
ncbi:hypothetical protein L1887_32623 [Cichorium endivia]|nr:hypothetical protein L1887_32623 [Cichorium endivia]